MKRLFFLLFLLGVSVQLIAQLTDDFSGSELSMLWQGQRDKFSVNNGELQLSDQAAGSNNTTVLYALAPTSTASTTTWEIKLRYAFAPSTSNFAEVVLMADTPPTAGGNYNGYYLKVGGISGADDAVELYRRDGNSSTLLLSGTIGAVGTNPVAVSLQIVRNTMGEWFLEADYNGGEDLDPDGSIVDATYTSGSYFGLSCRYTSTRNEAIFFDDIFVDPLVVDDTPPQAISVSATAADQLSVQFSEPVTLTNATFQVDGGIGMSISATPNAMDQSLVELNFATSFTNLQDYILTLSGANDLAGNEGSEQTLPFTFLVPETPLVGDLLITEIFPDPTPPVGLPNFEYIELYNRSNKVLQLGGLGLSTGGAPRTIDDYILLPNTYVTLCDQDAVAAFGAFGEVATLASFPALTNGGDDLIITNEIGSELVALTYAASWYQDELRSAGGYALELIDVEQANNCPGNWRASQSLAGGTPGQVNSIAGLILEITPPTILSALAVSEMEVLVRFDEILGNEIDLTDQFSISDGIDIGSALLEPNLESVRLFLSTPLADGQLYTLSILAGVSDCLGNVSTTTTTVQFGLATTPEPGDLIINEILFNPYTGGVDFIELHNPTDQVLDLTGLRLRNEAINSGTIGTVVENELVILPGDYLVLTSNPDNVLLNYMVPQPGNLILNRLPSLGDKEGNLSVYNAAFDLLDAVDYTEDWHNGLLRSRDGVSLERLRADAPTQDAGNWSSAASTTGFATPTGINSQDRSSVTVSSENLFTLANTTFSPDGDSFEDVLELRYQTDQSGYTGRILIFDENGRQVRDLTGLELLAGQGAILWDGTTDDGSKARIGIYILVPEFFTTQGDVIKEKHVVVLAGQLD